jgi:hypothetical protein
MGRDQGVAKRPRGRSREVGAALGTGAGSWAGSWAGRGRGGAWLCLGTAHERVAGLAAAGSREHGPEAAAMSAVDLARVGACVLKHAVTGEVRPGRHRAVGATGHLRWRGDRSPGRGCGPEGSPGGAQAESGCSWPCAEHEDRRDCGAWGVGSGPAPPDRAGPQAVELRSLWQEQACVVAGLRRFGCMVCRWIAKDLSSLKGLLDQHGVRLVGVGPEALGLQEFLDGGYFSGGVTLPHPGHRSLCPALTISL